MRAMKTRPIRSISIAGLLALASLALTLEVASASTEPEGDLALPPTREELEGGLALPPTRGELEGGSPPQQAPVLVASKSATLYTDADGDGDVSPGDVLLYRVTIENNGLAPATGVTFSDTPDPHTTLLTGTVEVEVVEGDFQIGPDAVVTGNDPGDTTVFVEIGDMPAGPCSEVQISYQAVITNPLPAAVIQVENQGARYSPFAIIVHSSPQSAIRNPQSTREVTR